MNWSDYMPQSFLDGFEKKTGITVKHTPFGSNEELLNKMRATKGRGFDLVAPTLDRAAEWQPLGLLQAFDMNKIETSKVVSTEERRVGKACVSTCRTRVQPYN